MGMAASTNAAPGQGQSPGWRQALHGRRRAWPVKSAPADTFGVFEKDEKA